MIPAGNVFAALGLAALIGGMLFFGAVVTPLVFAKLPPEFSSIFIRAVFPRYYAYMAICALLAALGFALRGWTVSSIVMVAIALAAAWGWAWLIPHMDAWRDAGNQAAFDRGHKVSVWLNGVEFVAALWLLARLVLA